jgi:predicted  nucleic acid-binding Zn-ribbon protein
MRADAEQRLAALRRDYEDGQGRLLQLEQQASALRDTVLRISGAIQVLEELLSANQESRDQHQPDAAMLHVR